MGHWRYSCRSVCVPARVLSMKNSDEVPSAAAELGSCSEAATTPVSAAWGIERRRRSGDAAAASSIFQKTQGISSLWPYCTKCLVQDLGS